MQQCQLDTQHDAVSVGEALDSIKNYQPLLLGRTAVLHTYMQPIVTV